MSKEFQFYSEFNLPILLGRKAKNINELMEGIKQVPGASIYYHTHRFLKQHHFLIPELPNDFAYWLRNVLNMRQLGELVSSINIVECSNLDQLRKKLIDSFESFNHRDEFSFNCAPGYEFQFMSCKTFSLPVPFKAGSLKEFEKMLKEVSIYVFYYHIFEPRLRRGKSKNDFAEWFEEIGETELSDRISRLDPYTMTIEEYRKKILEMVKQYGKN
jgi:hypothetical protein